MTQDNIPYILAVAGSLISICMMIALMVFWPNWRGWGAVTFITWPLVVAFVVTIGFIVHGVIRILMS